MLYGEAEYFRISFSLCCFCNFMSLLTSQYSFAISVIPYCSLNASSSCPFRIRQTSVNLPVCRSLKPATCSPLQILQRRTAFCVPGSNGSFTGADFFFRPNMSMAFPKTICLLGIFTGRFLPNVPWSVRLYARYALHSSMALVQLHMCDDR